MTATMLGDCDEYFVKAVVGPRLPIPLFETRVRAGFPSPAENYIERVCDLNDLCITNPEATYFVRVIGDSMTGDHIQEGDVLVVDASRKVADGKVAVVWFNGEHTVKRVHHAPPLVVLAPSNPNYQPIYVQPDDDFRVFGVVTFVIHKMR
ncbi:LexA family protein [Rudanella lutea]|uniref:LexA family protein n=1 Tax=Rudanella lutea TaxID=451374 RepID=UPI00038222EF|nr:translesion error-prone DNA polymerase V autoproteolytic subunit [Rudanella lutea]